MENFFFFFTTRTSTDERGPRAPLCFGCLFSRSQSFSFRLLMRARRVRAPKNRSGEINEKKKKKKRREVGGRKEWPLIPIECIHLMFRCFFLRATEKKREENWPAFQKRIFFPFPPSDDDDWLVNSRARVTAMKLNMLVNRERERDLDGQQRERDGNAADTRARGY